MIKIEALDVNDRLDMVNRMRYYKNHSMIDESTVRMRFTIDVIDCVQVILESLINTDSVAFRLPSIIRHQGLIQFCLLVNLTQLILL